VTKIFDFNFAIGLPPTGLRYDRYGSPQYMALTVRLSRGYGAAADACCFGVHLWDHCALETPFAAIAPRGIREGRLPWGPAVGQQPSRRGRRPLHRAQRRGRRERRVRLGRTGYAWYVGCMCVGCAVVAAKVGRSRG
jgi:hypothetical protein